MLRLYSGSQRTLNSPPYKLKCSVSTDTKIGSYIQLVREISSNLPSIKVKYVKKSQSDWKNSTKPGRDKPGSQRRWTGSTSVDLTRPNIPALPLLKVLLTITSYFYFLLHWPKDHDSSLISHQKAWPLMLTLRLLSLPRAWSGEFTRTGHISIPSLGDDVIPRPLTLPTER